MYSQNKEEQFITDYFKNKNDGFFVDIGGYNPFKFSNTRKLYELGWSGAYVEPSAICFQNFEKEYKDNLKISLFNFAIGSYNGHIEFYEANGDAISTTSTHHLEKWKKVGKFDKKQVEIKEINEFLSQFENIDFISIDVESTNIELFNLVQDKYWTNIKMICIEHDNYNEIIKNKLTKFGFKQIHINGENLIMAK